MFRSPKSNVDDVTSTNRFESGGTRTKENLTSPRCISSDQRRSDPRSFPTEFCFKAQDLLSFLLSFSRQRSHSLPFRITLYYKGISLRATYVIGSTQLLTIPRSTGAGVSPEQFRLFFLADGNERNAVHDEIPFFGSASSSFLSFPPSFS